MLDELAAETVEDAVYDRLIAEADLPLLLAALEAPPHKRVPERVCLVLEHLADERSVPALLKVLRTTTRARVRRAALSALAAVPPQPTPRACQLLLKHVRDERDEPTSRLAARALGRLKRPPGEVLDELELQCLRRPAQRAASRRGVAGTPAHAPRKHPAGP
jgi:HEAT repeat protein